MKRRLSGRMITVIPSTALVCLFGLSTQTEAAVIFEEDFSGCQYSGRLSWTTIGAAGTSYGDVPAVLPGWSGALVRGAFSTNSLGVTNRMVVLSTGSAPGWIQTPPKNLSDGDGDFTVTFRAGAWDNSTENTGLYVEHIAGTVTNRYEITTLSKTMMQPFTINMTNGTANSSVRFSARAQSSNRFFLDDVCIEQSALNIGIAPATATVLAGSTVSAVVTATDNLGSPLSAEVDDTNIPQGTPYSFDGKNFSWVPQVTGNFWVRFVAGNEIDSVSSTLNIAVGLPTPGAPTVETTAGSIYLTWDPVPGATGYSVQVYKPATEIDLGTEDFSSCTNRGLPTPTLIGVASGNIITNSFSNYGLAGWAGQWVYCAYASNMVNTVTNYMVKFSTESTNGWIQTPPWNLSANGGECILTFRAGKWRNDAGQIDVLHITGNGTVTNVLQQITGLSETTMTNCTVSVTGGTASSVICFTAQTEPPASGSNRFFLDDVRVFYVTAARLEVPSIQIIVDGTTARAFGLPVLSEYLCTVTATDGASETVSPEVPARTKESTLMIIR